MRTNLILLVAVFFLGTIFNGCMQNKKSKEHDKSEVLTENKESHARDYSEGEGEEDGTLYDINYKYNIEKNGVRLILSYDNEESKFSGNVENTTNETIKNVRVEIHLSNGKELGPTTPTNLKSGEKREIQIDAKGEEFDKWSTHAEVGNREHSHENKEKGEHSENSEHNKEKKSEHDGEHR